VAVWGVNLSLQDVKAGGERYVVERLGVYDREDEFRYSLYFVETFKAWPSNMKLF
jgi:hypothetical protein